GWRSSRNAAGGGPRRRSHDRYVFSAIAVSHVANTASPRNDWRDRKAFKNAPTFYPALFFFLASGAVALAAFGSVTSWVVARSRERESHERFALLRLLAERPVESARLAIDELRNHELRADERRHSDQRLGGFVTIGVGIGLSLMLLATSGACGGAWGVGMIPLLLGVALLLGSPRRPGR